MTAKQLGPALAVLLIPVSIFLIGQELGRSLFTEESFRGLLPWCLVPVDRGTAAEKPFPPEGACIRGAEKRSQTGGGEERKSDPKPAAPAAGSPGAKSGAANAPAPAGETSSSTSAAGGASQTGGSKASTLVIITVQQARAREFGARIDFAAGTLMLRVFAGLALMYAIILLRQWWWGRTRIVSHSEREWVFTFCVLAVGGGLLLAIAAHSANSVRNLLLEGPLQTAWQAGLVAKDAVDALTWISFWSLLFAYGVGGLLLACLAALALDSPDPIPDADRMTALQFILVAGAAIFTASIVTNKAAIGWVAGVLDPASSGYLLEAFKKIGDFWSLITSLFLLTAVGVTYFAIRGRNATVTPAAGEAADSTLALRTPTGEDFKVLGWIINLLIAFAPAWLSEAIFKTVDLFQKNALPQ